MADVVRHGRWRWFRHLERRSVDDWMSCHVGLSKCGGERGEV